MIGAAMPDGDPQPDQPGFYRGHSSPTACSPGRSVVGQDRDRQTIAAERLGQVRVHHGALLIWTGPQTKGIAGMIIDEGEGMETLGGGGQMAHEVDLPQRVRMGVLEAVERSLGQTDFRIDQAVPAQDVGDGAWRGNGGPLLRAQAAGELASSPVGVRQTRCHHLLLNLGRRPPR